MFSKTYRFPFDSKQPFGYIVGFTFQSLLALYLCKISAVFTAIGLGIFLLTLSVAEDINDDLISINKNAKNKKKRVLALKQLNEFVQYHSDAKQLSHEFLKFKLLFKLNFESLLLRLAHDFSNLFQPIFTVVFTWSTITICISLLLIQIDLVKC